jgi:hypothetical protein
LAVSLSMSNGPPRNGSPDTLLVLMLGSWRILLRVVERPRIEEPAAR